MVTSLALVEPYGDGSATLTNMNEYESRGIT